MLKSFDVPHELHLLEPLLKCVDVSDWETNKSQARYF